MIGGDACARAGPTTGCCGCTGEGEPKRRDPLSRPESAGAAGVSGGVTSGASASPAVAAVVSGAFAVACRVVSSAEVASAVDSDGAEPLAVVESSELVDELAPVRSVSDAEEVEPLEEAGVDESELDDAASEGEPSVSDGSADATPLPVAMATPSPTATAATEEAST